MNLKTRSRLSLRYKTRQKDNRRSVQRRIRFNPCGDIAAVRFRHDDIEKNEIGPDVLRCLMRPPWLILLPNGVAPSPFQSDSRRVSKVAAVINDQDARFVVSFIKE